MSTEEKNSTLGNHFLAYKKLAFEVSITANATPADKVHSIKDIPGVALLRTEGKVADADAVEDLSGDFTAAEDTTNGQFGVLIKGSELGSVKKVLRVQVTQLTATGTAIVVASPAQGSLVTDYLSDGGNIAIDITATGTDLETESPTFLIEVDYVKEL